MSITSVLQDTKARLDSLLSFANETTGQSDVSIGDAIKTLADGFGGGGSSYEKYTATATCASYGQVYAMIQSDGLLSTNANYVLVNKANKPTMQIVNFTTNNTTNLSIVGWRTTSCKGLAGLNSTTDATVCSISVGDEFLIIPY